MNINEFKVKILGIVATPIREGNTQFIVEEALRMAEKEGPVETEVIHLDDYQIGYCKGCEGCLKRVHMVQKKVGMDIIPIPVQKYNCSIKDDMELLHSKLLECDGLILGSPVYIATIPAQLKTFLDRCRTFVHDYRLRSKVAQAVTVAFYRNAGEDTALAAMNITLLGLGFIIVGYGASAVSTREGLGILIKESRIAVTEDQLGMRLIRAAGSQVAQYALRLKAGARALKEAGIELREKAMYTVPGDMK
jgi:multimeric flavodoxin WrbA